jgi:hypothetical protein
MSSATDPASVTALDPRLNGVHVAVPHAMVVLCSFQMTRGLQPHGPWHCMGEHHIFPFMSEHHRCVSFMMRHHCFDRHP